MSKDNVVSLVDKQAISNQQTETNHKDDLTLDFIYEQLGKERYKKKSTSRFLGSAGIPERK